MKMRPVSLRAHFHIIQGKDKQTIYASLFHIEDKVSEILPK